VLRSKSRTSTIIRNRIILSSINQQEKAQLILGFLLLTLFNFMLILLVIEYTYQWFKCISSVLLFVLFNGVNFPMSLQKIIDGLLESKQTAVVEDGMVTFGNMTCSEGELRQEAAKQELRIQGPYIDEGQRVIQVYESKGLVIGAFLGNCS